MNAKLNASGRKEADGAWFFSLPLQREVMIMSDYEMLGIIIMIITMAFSIHSIPHKK